MKNRETGNLAVSAALALAAGVLGSVLTLLFTNTMGTPAAIETHATSEQLATEPEPVGRDLSIDSLAVAEVSENVTQASENSLAALNEALQLAAEERVQLADVLAQLTRQIESVESDLINLQSLDALDTPTAIDLEEVHSVSGAGNNGAGGFRGATPAATVDNLVAAGVDVTRAQALQARQNQYQLARLELVDQAEREGWRDSEQFSERMSELQEQRPDLRTELGDDAYDRYLFEAGRGNRVFIGSIIPGSEADLAGIQVGDIIFAYAGSRMFTPRELQRATREGQRGESVTVQVVRQEQPLFLELARGPLGVTLNVEQQNPS